MLPPFPPLSEAFSQLARDAATLRQDVSQNGAESARFQIEAMRVASNAIARVYLRAFQPWHYFHACSIIEFFAYFELRFFFFCVFVPLLSSKSDVDAGDDAS